MMDVWYQCVHTYAEVDLSFLQLRHVDGVHGGRRCTVGSRLAGVSASPDRPRDRSHNAPPRGPVSTISAAMGQQGSQLLNDMEQNTHCRLVSLMHSLRTGDSAPKEAIPEA